jgi:hypothetical protein
MLYDLLTGSIDFRGSFYPSGIFFSRFSKLASFYDPACRIRGAI